MYAYWLWPDTEFIDRTAQRSGYPEGTEICRIAVLRYLLAVSIEIINHFK